MDKKALLTHGGWAVAAAAAFGIGALLDPGAARDPETGNQSGNARSGTQGPPPRPTNSRSGGRSATGDDDGGLVSRTFGRPVSSSSSIEFLAAQAFDDPNPVTRRIAFSKLLESMTAENAPTIREQLVELGADASQWHDFSYAWGGIAGKEAFLFGRESPERDMEAALTGWTAARPDEALALLENLPEEMENHRGKLTRSVVEGLADHDLNLATDYVLRLSNEGFEGTAGLISAVTGETIRSQGPAEAAKWSESLPDGPVKATAMNQIAERFVRKDPAAAAEWAGQFAKEDYATGIIARIGKRWTEKDPVAAADWLTGLPGGEGQLAGLRSSFGDWEDRDPVAAGDYLMKMPASAQRDSAISGFANGYAWQDPETAIAWAQDIGDPALRERALIRSGQAYIRRNPEAARTWLETSGLSAKARQKVLNSGGNEKPDPFASDRDF